EGESGKKRKNPRNPRKGFKKSKYDGSKEASNQEKKPKVAEPKGTKLECCKCGKFHKGQCKPFCNNCNGHHYGACKKQDVGAVAVLPPQPLPAQQLYQPQYQQYYTMPPQQAQYYPP